MLYLECFIVSVTTTRLAYHKRKRPNTLKFVNDFIDIHRKHLLNITNN